MQRWPDASSTGFWEFAGAVMAVCYYRNHAEMLIYHWRGRHDFLYFYVRDDRVVRAGWWMAGE